VVLSHGALVDGALARASVCDASFGEEEAAKGVVKGPRALAEIVATGRAIDRLRRRGAWSRACEEFSTNLAERVPGRRAHSFVAEELAVVAGFFAVDARGHVDWTSLREEVAAGSRGTLLLRAGLGLRSLGRLARASVLLGEAAAAFAVQGAWAQAAASALEGAVVEMWRVPACVGDAEERIASAVNCAERARRRDHQARAQALRGVLRARAGHWERAEEDFSAAREGLRSYSDVAVLAGLVGLLVWTAELDRLDADGEAGPPRDALDVLAGRLEVAKELHQRTTAPAFASGLDALARGRLARLYARRRGSMPCRSDNRRGWSEPGALGRVELGRAIALFGATQQHWLLPAAYRERARLRDDVFGDAAGAERDRHRADLLDG
jgi:hypothetical protein